MQMTLRLGLNRLRHRVQHTARFVEPAGLLIIGNKDNFAGQGKEKYA